jgi:E3 ubiquitin-protein ligase BRE1
VEAIRVLVRPEDLPPVDIKTRSLFDLSMGVSGDAPPALKTALEYNVNATQTLLAKFMQMGGQNASQMLRDDALGMYQKVQNEV